MRDWAVRRGWDLKLVKNEKQLILATCKNECNWKLRASSVMKSTTFQIKSIKGKHTCAHKVENKQANYKYIGKRLESFVRDNPNESLQFEKKVRRELQIEVSDYKVYRAKKYALELIRGDVKEQYARLYDYCHTVVKHNPASSLIMKLNKEVNPPVLQRMYFCLKGMRDGFIEGCRPLIGLDGCFLKGLFKGQLLAAIGRDPNDNIYPIAVAYVEVEKYDSWEWFLNLLLRDIGSHNERGWAFISDRQKGLLEAIAELAPGAEHRFCLRHMYNNFKGKFKGQKLKKMFWKAASTYNVNQHLKTMAEIQNMYPKRVGEQTPYEWLAEIPPVHWARCFFPTKTRCDVLVNNMNESFNHIIMEARELPIIDMFEWIRKKFMTRIQLVGYPCCHAIAAIDYHRLKMEDFIDECFKKEVYLKVYSHMIHPVPGMHDFEDSKMGRVEPPDNQDQRRQGSSTSHGASGSRRYLQFFPNHQDSQPHVPVQPQVPSYDPPPQTAPRNPFKSSRTAPDETTTRGFNVHKPSYEQAIHSKKTTQQSVQQQHPQSSGLHQVLGCLVMDFAKLIVANHVEI
ncbi:hypothetical protein Sango_2487600 [Sesamum angolense]|uniref:MULE transposase domain-containing protein n=1 Tax=Sesamum angolense TaxID=2727404 RepID=A0AAE1W3N4_9LAMI|nr:hypothetical protein Sango_2487600 [Sesamum angolense]